MFVYCWSFMLSADSHGYLCIDESCTGRWADAVHGGHHGRPQPQRYVRALVLLVLCMLMKSCVGRRSLWEVQAQAEAKHRSRAEHATRRPESFLALFLSLKNTGI